MERIFGQPGRRVTVARNSSALRRLLLLLAAMTALMGFSATVPPPAQGEEVAVPRGDNGAVTLDQRAAQIGSVINAGWQEFNWFEDGYAIQTFSVTTTRAIRVTITDVLCTGDAFAVTSGERVLIVTPSVTADCGYEGFTGDPDVALMDPAYSHGSFILRPGTYELSIQAVENPFGSGTGYIRFDFPPRPLI
jgi:hypothetical protein